MLNTSSLKDSNNSKDYILNKNLPIIKIIHNKYTSKYLNISTNMKGNLSDDAYLFKDLITNIKKSKDNFFEIIFDLGNDFNDDMVKQKEKREQVLANNVKIIEKELVLANAIKDNIVSVDNRPNITEYMFENRYRLYMYEHRSADNALKLLACVKVVALALLAVAKAETKVIKDEIYLRYLGADVPTDEFEAIKTTQRQSKLALNNNITKVKILKQRQIKEYDIVIKNNKIAVNKALVEVLNYKNELDAAIIVERNAFSELNALQCNILYRLNIYSSKTASDEYMRLLNILNERRQDLKYAKAYLKIEQDNLEKYKNEQIKLVKSNIETDNRDNAKILYNPEHKVYCIKYINPKPVGPFDKDIYINENGEPVTLQFFSFDHYESNGNGRYNTPVLSILSKYYDEMDNTELDYKIISEYRYILAAYTYKKICYLTEYDIKTKFKANGYVNLKSSIIPTLNTIDIDKKYELYDSFIKLYLENSLYRHRENIGASRFIKIQDDILPRNTEKHIVYDENDRVHTIKMIYNYNDTFVYNQDTKIAVDTILSYPLNDTPDGETNSNKHHQYIYGMFLLYNYSFYGSKFNIRNDFMERYI